MMRRHIGLRIFRLLALVTVAQPAIADESKPPPAQETSTADEQGCADSEAKRKGVQRRDFLKRHRLELSAWGGLFASDVLSTSYNFGGALGFYFTEDLGLEVSLVIAPFELGIERPLTQLFEGQRFHNGNAYILVGDFIWSPIHLKLRASETAIIHGDVVFALGAGNTFHDSVQGATFDAGVGLKLYPTRWLALRLDLRDYLLVQEVVSVQRVTNNLVGLFGLSVYVPPWF